MSRGLLIICALVFVLSACAEDTRPPAPTALEPAPRRPLAEPLRGILGMLSQGRFDEARQIAEQYIESTPGDSDGYLMLGLVWQKADNHSRAIDALLQAAVLTPGDARVRHYLAESAFLVGDLELAREHHAAHAQLDPSEPDASYGLGLVELEYAELDAAEQHFRQAIELFDAMKASNARAYAARRGDLGSCHARLADVHFARDDYAAARDELILATRIAPGNLSAFHTLSLVHRRLGEDELADAALRHYEQGRDAILGAGG